jgi:hypothetical protein
MGRVVSCVCARGSSIFSTRHNSNKELNRGVPDQEFPRFEYALYDSVAQLDRALNALTYAVNECRDGLKN